MDLLCSLYCVRNDLYPETHAAHRAHELLARHLTEDQRRELLSRTASVRVRGAVTGTMYRVAYEGTVFFNGPDMLGRVCSAPEAWMPAADRLLAVLLMLQSDPGEQHFLDNAFPQGPTTPGYGLPPGGGQYLWVDPGRGWFRVRGERTIFDAVGDAIPEIWFNDRSMRIEPALTALDRARRRALSVARRLWP